MSTSDTVDTVKKPRGRPKKTADVATPMGELIARETADKKSRKEQNRVVEKYYELHRGKLSLCKKMAGGSVYKTYIGSTDDPKHGRDIKEYAEGLKAKGQLRQKV